MLKMAVFAPIPSASVKTAISSEPRRFAELPKSESDVVHD